jgi:hypothetical protein
MKVLFLAVLLLVLFFASTGAFGGKDVCVTVDGLNVCVQVRGSCDLSYLIPNERSDIHMDLFYISIVNNSERRIRLVPNAFYGITGYSIPIIMDSPFYESVQLKKKLIKKDLYPKDKIDGFIFFPTHMGSITSIGYGGKPHFEIKLY